MLYKNIQHEYTIPPLPYEFSIDILAGLRLLLRGNIQSAQAVIDAIEIPEDEAVL